MESKSLDFDQPLLSVRRFPQTTTSSKSKCTKSPETNLTHGPPMPYYKSDLKSGPVRNPGTVPFTWEQSPGKPKTGPKQQMRALTRPPRLSQGLNLNAKQPVLYKDCDDRNASNRSDLEDFSDSVASDETYLDALETLSRTESSFLNCTVSGLNSPNLKFSGAFSVDNEGCDFMMNRFLPAAKAMTSEAHSTFRKQLRETREVDNEKGMLLSYGQNKSRRDEDSSDDESATKIACVLFPRFCIRNSVFNLNQIPGPRVPHPISSVRSVRTRSSHLVSKHIPVKSIMNEIPRETKDDGGHTVEKALYMDSVHDEESQTLSWRLSDRNELTKVMKNDFKPRVTSEAVDESPEFDFGKDSKIAFEDGREASKKNGLKKYNATCAQLPLILPLPKSPTDSWLYRTLPSISSRKYPSSCAYYPSVENKLSCDQPSMDVLVDPKWETIVKASNVHGHKELILPVADT